LYFYNMSVFSNVLLAAQTTYSNLFGRSTKKPQNGYPLRVERVQLSAPTDGGAMPKKSSSADMLKNINLQNAQLWDKDMRNLRQAIDSARDVMSPRRAELQIIYEGITLDAHITALMQARRMRIMANDWTFTNAAGEDLPEVRAAFEKAWFFEAIEKVIDSIFYGYTLLELQYDPTIHNIARTLVIPRSNVIAERGIVVREIYDEYGVEWRTQPQYWIFSAGHTEDLGLLQKAASHIIIKKIIFGSWAQYAEIFGMPIRIGKVASASQADRDQMAEDLQNMASAAYAVTGIGDDIEIKETAKGDAYQVYNQFIERINSEVSKLFLGQTMTTDNGSSRSQGEVHERVAEAFAASDRRFVQFTINDNLLPLLRRIGFALPDDCRFEFKQHQEMNDIDIKVLEMLFTNCELSENALKQISKRTGYEVVGMKNTVEPPLVGSGTGEVAGKPTARSGR
jgi:Protein of unknown function (DUF935)